MAGIYLHIPFCRRACTYCDFHFSTQLARRDELVLALAEEARLRKDFFDGGTVLKSIYFGGGTPSLLEPGQVGMLLETIKELWPVKADAEITLEANPDDLDLGRLAGFREAGVNRLSIGIQSFRDEDLRWMNRSHDAEQAQRVVEDARKVGFENITIDLIYGIPGLSDEAWADNVAKALALGLPHISAYAMTVEKKTALHKQVQKGVTVLPPDDVFVGQYFYLIDQLEAAGYVHYELSNFALPGQEARHNSAYWEGAPYLGLGPSAHSYDGVKRAWNVANNAKYLAALGQGEAAIDAEEVLLPNDRLNEYLMTGLRKAEGIDLRWILAHWGVNLMQQEGEAIEYYLAQGWMVASGERLKLSRAGKMVSDEIIANLFQVS